MNNTYNIIISRIFFQFFDFGFRQQQHSTCQTSVHSILKICQDNVRFANVPQQKSRTLQGFRDMFNLGNGEKV